MIIKSSAVAAVIAAALSAKEASCFALTPPIMIPSSSSARSHSALHAGIPADVPMWSDDVTGRSGGSGNSNSLSSYSSNGPNPLNVRYTDTLVRTAYEDWRVVYGRGDFDTDRFAIFKVNYLASLRAYQLQTARAKMEGRALPQQPLEMNAYADCSETEYKTLQDQEQRSLMRPRTKVKKEEKEDNEDKSPAAAAAKKEAKPSTPTPAAAAAAAAKKDPPPQKKETPAQAAATKATTSYTSSTPNNASSSRSVSPDARGQAARSVFNFPKRTAAHSAPPLKSSSPSPPPPAKKKQPAVAPLQEQLQDLKKAADELSSAKGKAAASKTAETKKPAPSPPAAAKAEPFPSLSSKPLSLQEKFEGLKKATQQLPTAASSSNKPKTGTISEDRKPLLDPSITTRKAPLTPTATSPAGPKKTAPVKKPSQFTGVASASQKSVPLKHQRPSASYYLQPDNIGSFGDPSAKYFPKRTPAHTPPKPESTPKQPPKNKSKVTSPSPLQTATSFPKRTEAHDKGTRKKDADPSSSHVKADLRGPDDKQSATTFPKRTEAHGQGTIRKEGKATTTTSEAETSSSDPSLSSLRPDNFNLSQSATDFPKRATTTTTTTTDPKKPTTASSPAATTPSTSSTTTTTSPESQKAAINPSKSTVKPDVFYKDQSQLATNFPKRTPSHAAPLVRAEEFQDDGNDADASTTEAAGGPSISSGGLQPDGGATAAPFSFKRAASNTKNNSNNSNPKSRVAQQQQQATADLPPPEYTRPEPSATVSAEIAPLAVEEDTIDTLEKDEQEEEDVQEDAPKEEGRKIPTLQDMLKAELEAAAKEDAPPAPEVVDDEESIVAKESPPRPPTLEELAREVKYRTDAKARMKKWQELQDAAGAEEAGSGSGATDEEAISIPLVEAPSSATVAKETVPESPPVKDDVTEEERAQNALIQELFQRSLLETQLQFRKVPDDDTVDESSSDQESKSESESLSIPTQGKETASPATPAPVEAATRQDEIEEALKADFNNAAGGNPSEPADPLRQKQIKAVFEGTAPESVDPSTITEPLTRQQEIENALKADFNAAASQLNNPLERQRAIEAVFEGKVQVKTRQEPPVYDPFDVRPEAIAARSGTPMPSVQDVLQAAMNAAKSLSTQEPSPSPAVVESSTPSIQDILKAEREAAEKMKTSSAQVDATVYPNLSSSSSSSSSSAPTSKKEIESQSSSNDDTLKAEIDSQIKKEGEQDETSSKPKGTASEKMSNRERKKQKWKANNKKKGKKKKNNNNASSNNKESA